VTRSQDFRFVMIFSNPTSGLRLPVCHEILKSNFRFIVCHEILKSNFRLCEILETNRQSCIHSLILPDWQPTPVVNFVQNSGLLIFVQTRTLLTKECDLPRDFLTIPFINSEQSDFRGHNAILCTSKQV
jgi:hypothetical protein